MNDIDIKQTIDFWESWLNQKKSANIGEFMMYGGRSLDVCKTYLQEKAARENPQPLTLEQLRQMDGKPVKIYEDGEYQYGLVSLSGNWFTQEEVITLSNGNFYLFNELAGNAEIYNIAYDHEPKEI